MVDQTIEKDNPNFRLIYNSICKLLSGGDVLSVGIDKNASYLPELGVYKFDANVDQLSVFAFALTGASKNKGTDFCNIFEDKKSKPDEIFQKISKSLLHERRSYRSTRYAFDEYINKVVKPLFEGKDTVYKKRKEVSAITLSHYVYPLVLNYIDTNISAKEYILLIISDFKSGTFDVSDSSDRNRVIELLGENSKNFKYFEEEINNMRRPFVQAEICRMVSGDVSVFGTKLVVKKSLESTPLSLISNIELTENVNGKFKVSPSKILFKKDDVTQIDSLIIELKTTSGQFISKVVIDGYNIEYDPDNWQLSIPEQTFEDADFGSLDGDAVLTYNLYTIAKDGSNKKSEKLLPIVYSADRTIDSSEIHFINKKLRKAMIIIFTIFAIIGILVYLIFRGRKKHVLVSVGKFASKYVNVDNNKGAVELPCWFRRDKEFQKGIRVTGCISRKGFSIGGKVKLLARLQDGQPEGFKYYINGKNADAFIPIEIKAGSFMFNVDIAVNPSVIDDKDLSHCKVLIDFAIESSVFGKFRHVDYFDDVPPIEFYFTRDLGTAWVGLDPGTTGSCVSFGCTGGSLDDPNIAMVKSNGKSSKDVIPSKLILNKNFGSMPITKLRPGEDYLYGDEADTKWNAAIVDGQPCFQSIKKLLGYKNSGNDLIKIHFDDKTIRNVKGLELAHLLIKGLKKELDANIASLSRPDKVRYAGVNGRPQRAVVAIPNNYTLPKILDMVNSVRMLGDFSEVRYIYETEGVLFNYFRKNYRKVKAGSETIMIYDMGGATINLSVYKIDYRNKDGVIYYDVQTLARLGYAVGGDNIDVAIMEYIYTLDQIDTEYNTVEKRHKYQIEHKSDILRHVFSLKLNIIRALNGENSKIEYLLQNKTGYATYLQDWLKSYGNIRKEMFDRFSFVANDKHPFAERIALEIIESMQLRQYVYNNVSDAVQEILCYPALKGVSKLNKIIFSGRSTMFPQIRDIVCKETYKKFKDFNVYEGLNGDEVKTSVSYGACWYGIYNSLVTLDNSRLIGAYGYKITRDGNSNLKVLLNQNDAFDIHGKVSASEFVSSDFAADGNVVDFYQVMGSGQGERLFARNNRHKVNYIGSINVPITTERISMSVNRCNVVTCSVEFNTGDTDTVDDLNVLDRDITKENDWAYTFAASTEKQKSLSEGVQSVRTRSVEKHKTKKSTTTFPEDYTRVLRPKDVIVVPDENEDIPVPQNIHKKRL